MITGFNTDIDYQGVTYHVQTEDKGLATPLILSLVYERGTILAAKRSPYDDLLIDGLDEKALAARLSRQHKLICAAITAGRIEDLKRLSAKAVEVVPAAKAASPASETDFDAAARIPMPDDELVWDIPLPEIQRPDESRPESQVLLETEAVVDSADVALVKEISPFDPSNDKSLRIKLFGASKFIAGERIRLNVLICRGGEESSVADASIMVKVLGSDFRPLIFHSKADANGVAGVMVKIPNFRSGRAAILVRAMTGGEEAELRRVITHDR